MARLLPAAPVLLGPAVLAFFKGGYFDGPRLWAAAAAWLLAAVVVLTRPRPLPAGPGRVAVAGLAALAAWTGASIAWAPVAGPAVASFERGLLYLGALAAAVPLLRTAARRAVAEPVLLAGILAAALYALSERLLPSMVSLPQIASAGDRLNQPLTYWNAMGALCAMGLVLAAGLVADPGRPRALRAGAAACAPALGLALYLTFSRGALGAAVASLAVLVALSPARRTAAAAILVGVAGGIPALATVALHDVTRAGGSAGQGAAMLALLVVLAAGAAVTAARLAEARALAAVPGTGRRALRGAALAVLAVAVIGSGVAAVSGESRGGEPPTGANAERLVSVQSNRYAYWKVAVRTFADHPVAGVGAGGFAVEWLRERRIPETVRDAHSLYIETAAELGLIGLAALAVLLAGAVLAARDALRRAGATAVPAVAAMTAWALHAAIDWDWEMPALTLVAVVLLARLCAEAEPVAEPLSAPDDAAAARPRPAARLAT